MSLCLCYLGWRCTSSSPSLAYLLCNKENERKSKILAQYQPWISGLLLRIPDTDDVKYEKQKTTNNTNQSTMIHRTMNTN